MTSSVSLFTASTEQSADSIEAHPTRSGLFALGTYQIQQQHDQHAARLASKGDRDDDDDEPNGTAGPPITRKGTIRLLQSRDAGDDGDAGRLACDTLQTIDTAAVLDMKWLDPRTSLLSVALETSAVDLYRLKDDDEATARLTHAAHIPINHSGALCLSLDWSDRTGGAGPTSPSSSASAIVSQSDGTLAYLPGIDGGASVRTWHAHEYEAWCAAYDCWSAGNVVWSGGDDLTLKGWDVRMPGVGGNDSDSDDDGGERTMQPTFLHKRSFEGGVTSMQSHHLVQHLWAVGSYDGHVRLFDARSAARPVSTTNVGGGVWRVKWHPTKRDTLLVACMHDGFKVLTLDGTDADDDALTQAKSPMQLRARFDAHKSLAYGCDWDRGRCAEDKDGGEEADYVYSCSFYDAALHAWACG